jgi:hypothetical protein
MATKYAEPGSRQVNVAVAERIYLNAKDCALRAGMLFRAWVERAIKEQTEREIALRKEGKL